MIYLCTALYCEAKPFIKALNLKKDTSITKFQVFKNDNVTLIISGCGKIKAAISITFLFSKMKLEKKSNNILINIGICGSIDSSIPIGSCFLCNKIIDNDTKYCYYPDIIFKNPFKENSIETFSHIVSGNDKPLGTLVDLEASGIYEAASYFIQPHEIFFIKIVSDYLDSSQCNKEDINLFIKQNLNSIIEWINFLLDNYNFDNKIFSKEDISLYESISSNLKFSEYMKDELKNLMTYYKLQNKDINNCLLKYKDINCNSKKEGKKYLEEIKSKLI